MKILLCISILFAVACSNVQRAEVNTILGVNEYRQQAGLPTLVVDPILQSVAQKRADELAQTEILSHTPPDGCNAFCLMDAAGLSPVWAAENIGWNTYDWTQSSNQMLLAWKNSPEHYANILNCHLALVGSGVTMSADGRIWYAMVFWGDRSC